MQHYVYKITCNKPIDERIYYIGVKSSENPETDNYYGSSNYLNEAIKEIGIQHFSKTILSFWETRVLAEAEESRLHKHYKVASNPLYFNMFESTATGFTNYGMVSVIDLRDKKTKNVSKEDFDRFDYYVSTIFNTVSVIDTRDGSRKRVSKDDYYKFDYYQSILNGQTKAIDINTNEIINCTVDELKTNPDLMHINKNKIVVKDKSTLETYQVTVQEYQNNENLILSSTGKVTVKNTITNKKEFVSIDEFKNNENLISIHKNLVLVKLKNETFKKIPRTEFDQEIHTTPCNNTVSIIDIRDNSKKRISYEEYIKYDYYVNPNSKKINIYDAYDNLQYSVYGSFMDFCKKNNLPGFALAKSYRNNTSIYENSKQSQITKLEKDGFYKFKGWYARLIN